MADLIKRLLRDTPAYRNKWEHQLKGPSRIEPPVSAVARVITGQLRTEDDTATDDELFKRAKPLVAKAFQGDQLSRRTLDLVIQSFAIDESPADLNRLEWLWMRRSVPSAIGELGAVWTALVETSPEIFSSRQFQRTVLLVEEHAVGPDRKPAHHRTRQVIEALVDGPDRHLYLHDAPDATVTIEKGGVARRTLHLPASLIGLEIVYERPLRAGETRTLIYETRFRYPEQPPPNFRRAALREVDSMSLVLKFDAAAVPRHVWWCTWAALELEPEEREEVALGYDLSAERFVASAGGHIVGFEWRWDDVG
jgi:hypothetical protein